MYNPYISDVIPQRHPLGDGMTPVSYIDVTPVPVDGPLPRNGPLSSLKLPEIGMDTLIMLALVWFLVEGELSGETLLIVAVLLLLGF